MTTNIEIQLERKNLEACMDFILSEKGPALRARFLAPDGRDRLETYLVERISEQFPETDELVVALPLIEGDAYTQAVLLYKGLWMSVSIYQQASYSGNDLDQGDGATQLDALKRQEAGQLRTFEVLRDVPNHKVWLASCSLLMLF